MKRLAAFAFLLLASVPAQALVWCHGERVATAANDEACPERIYSPSITPNGTGGILSFMASGSGTVAVYIEENHDQPCPGCPTASPTTQSERQVNYARLDDRAIIDGDGGETALVSQVVGAAGSHSIVLTGTQAQTQYTVHAIIYDAEGNYYEAISINLTTPDAPSMGGEDLTDSGYFVGCGAGASDSNDGLSHATRWASFDKVNATSMPNGSNLYAQTDCVFEDQRFVPTYTGLVDDRALVSGYCVDTSDGNKPKGWVSGAVGCGALPEINGTYEDACGAATGDASACEFALSGSNSAAVPTSQSSGIVQLNGKQYFTIESIAIHDSAGNGLQIDEQYSTPSKFIGRNLEFDNILKRAVLVVQAVAGGDSFHDNYRMTDCSLQIVDGLGGIWSACVSFNSNNATINSGIVMQNSSIIRGGAEGYSTLSIGFVVFRENYSADNMRVHWFPDASQDVVFERMTAVASPNPLLPGFKSELFATAVECYGPALTYDSIGHVLRDSVGYNISGDANFIRVAVEGNPGCPEPHRSNGYDPRTEGFKVGVKAYNNTFFAAAGTVFAVKCTVCPTDPGEMVFKQNAFIGTELVQNAASDWVVERNYWDAVPSDADMSSLTDIIGGANMTNSPAWDSLAPPTIADATPPVGSSLRGGGGPITDVVLDAANYANFANFSGGCDSMSAIEWGQASLYDNQCTLRVDELGAVEVP